MKNYFKISFILLALIGVLFTSCKKDYLEPPIQVLPVGTVYTIDSILKMESGTVFDTASVYGIITADEKSGNLYKTAFMQDRATGAAIELYLNATSGLRIGDSVRVYLKDVTYAMYNGLPQLSNFEADGHIVILANNKPIEPAETTIADIVAGNHLAGLVKLSNVMFTEQNTFAEPTGYGNRTLVDPTDFSKTVIVRTSNYANFAYDSLPQGTGSLTCIASVYNTTWQLLIRSASELKFDGYTPGGGGTSLPYYQDFASSFGTYSTYDVSGAESWMIDYNTAKMTGYVGGANKANEDWLISSPVSLEGVNQVNMTMTYIARYFNNLNEDVTIQVSTDYTAGDPNQATWTQVPATLSEGSNWNDFLTATIDLSQFVGQKVVVAVKYVSNEVKAGTIEIQSILIQEGGGVTPPPGPGTGGEEQSMPYTQSFATEFGTYLTKDVLGPQSWAIDYSTAKMTGYASGSNSANEDWLISSPVAITGVENAKASVTYVAQYQNSDSYDITLQVSTNYVYGDEPGDAAWTQMSTTFPNTGGWSDFQTVETSLNDYIGQTITVAIKFTSTDSQSRTIEIQSITIQEGEAGGGVTPPDPPTPGDAEGSGTAEDPYNVAAGIANQGQENVWVHGYIVGAVKNGTSSVSSNDDIIWDGTFDSQTNALIADDPTCNDVSLCVIVNLPAGKPLRSQVNLVDNPSNLGKMLSVRGKLRTYFGQAGLRDSGGTESDFVLEGGDTPTPPPTPSIGIFSETFANGQGEFNIVDVNLSGLSYVWAYMNNYHCMKANGFYQGAHDAESWLVSPQIDLTTVTTATLSFEHALAFADGQGVCSVQVSTNYNGDVTTAAWTEMPIDTWPEQSNTFPFVTTTVNLNQFVGQTVTIAFKYNSTTNQCPAWEVKNLVIE